MRVRDVMTARVLTAGADTPIGRVARMMMDEAVSGIPVVDADDHVLGMVTEWNLVERQRAVEPAPQLPIMEGRMPLESPTHFLRRLQHVVGAQASDVMTEDVPTIGPDAGVDELAELMLEKRANPIPVVDGGRLVGIVSRADLVRMMVREVEGA